MRRPRLMAGIVLLAIAIAVGVFRAPLLRALVSAGIDVATGSRVSFQGLALDGSTIDARGVHLVRGSGLVLDVRRALVRYDVAEAAFGGPHRFGLRSISLDEPTVVVTRRRDGSFDVGPLGGGSGAGSAPAPPLLVTLVVRDGRVTLRDPARSNVRSRELSLTGIAARAGVDSAHSSTYRATARAAGDAAARFTFAGRLDADGFAVQHLVGRDITAAPFVNYFIDSPSATVLAGIVPAGDVRFYSFGRSTHVVGQVRIADAAMRVPGLLLPATHLDATIGFYDNGIATARLHARLGSLAAVAAGGLYGFDSAQPKFELAISVPNAPLARAKRLFGFSKALPLAGDARLTTLLEGPAPKPVVITHVTAPRAAYGAFPLAELDGRAYLYDGVVAVGGTHARYAGLDVGAGGTIVVRDVARSDLVATIDGPAAGVPYAAQVAPHAMLHVVARLAGSGLRIDALGELAGESPGARGPAATDLAGFFHIDPLGEGTFGPLLATRGDGASLAGTLYLDRPRSASALWLDAHDYTIAAFAPAPRLPGLALAPPDFAGRLDGSVAGFGPPSDFRLAGRVGTHDLRLGKLALGDATALVTGHLGDLRLGAIDARGAWGTLAGSGAFVGPRLALVGTYRGSFEALRTFTGELGARGRVNGPIALTIDPRETIVQARGDDARGSRVQGVPVDTLAGTVALSSGGRLRVYAANARVASGGFVAAGSLATGIGVSLGAADAARLHVLVPVDGGGRVATIGRFSGVGRATRYTGGVTLAGAHFQRIPVAGSGDIAFGGTHLDFIRTTALAGDAVAALDGSLSALGTKGPRYDARIALAATPLGPLARALQPSRHDISGTVAGNFAVHGGPGTLAVRGRFSVPEGTIEGLAFRDASATIALAPGGIGARHGTVTVGSTTVAFGGFFRSGDGGFRIAAPQADLADFNDLFDTGDTLGGRGHIDGRFFKRHGVVRSRADIAIRALKYRNFDLGDAAAHWASRGASVTGTVAFGGRSGRLETAGTLDLAANAPLGAMLTRSRFTGDAHLSGLDLGVWLPAVGYPLPVTGRVDADATIAGKLSSPDVRTIATLRSGTFGRLPVNSLRIVASSTLSRTTLQSLALDVPALSLTGSGSFGLRARDPIALRLHAKSPDIGTLSNGLFGHALPLAGTAEADVKVDGTRASPRVAGGFDLEAAKLRGVAVPRALGEFSVRGRDLVLSDVEVAFTTGTLYVAGSLPLELAPLGFGPARAPIELDLAAKGIDVANFAPLFATGSRLKGTIAGQVGVSGTAAAPRLNGSLALTNGGVTSPLETIPVTDVRGSLDFAGTRVTLRELHAAAGGGTVDATGTVALDDLVNLGAEANYRFEAKARALRVALPAYGSGKVDGTLALEHTRGSMRTLSGNLVLSDGTIPFAALLLPSGTDTGIEATPVAPLPVDSSSVALDLDVAAERNVRVRSANVDLGGRGSLHIGGTLGAPALSGGFDSTGGTLTYFNTVFRVLDGRVSFTPDRGLIPDLVAHAETHVIDPDPNAIRNIAGSADVTLDVHGPVTGLAIGLSSDPQYDREQILGLLLNAPALGATNLFDTPGQATLYGSNSPSLQVRDPAASRYNNGSTTVAQEAFGIANAQFTRTLLAPAETTFASAVGLSNFNVNVDLSGSVGLQARKVLGKEVSAVYGTTIGYPYRQTFGFELKPSAATAAQATVFQTFGNAGLSSLTPSIGPGFGTTRLTSTQPSTGTVGFSVSLQRLFP